MKKRNLSDLEFKKQSFEVDNKSILNWEMYYEAEKIPRTKFINSEMILPFDQFVNQLTESQLTALLNHFKELYTCEKLEERELKICYLAYSWKHNEFNLTNFRYVICNSDALGINGYIEASKGRTRVINWGVLNNYYVFRTLEKLV